MVREYMDPEVEVVYLETEDIITTSGVIEDFDDYEDWGEL